MILDALQTGGGMLWKALWALIFGYLISAAIQVVVTREQMARTLGEKGPKQGALAAFFGFVSSSCSFAALASARTVLVKGAHPLNSLAFLVASTNLVIELGIVLLVLLGWKFLLGNVLMGLLMLVYAYAFSYLYFPMALAEQAKKRASEQQKQGEGMQHGDMSDKSWKEKLTSTEGWASIADAFFMEWKMVYKEILFGFTVAGFVSVFVPQSFWNAVFLVSSDGASVQSPSFLVLLENVFVAPLVAFFTFIGSMGNVPLAAMLWSKNGSLGGVMSFLGADLVAATVVWVHAKYYGWKYAAYLSLLLYFCMALAGLTVHGLFALLGIMPTERPSLERMIAFEIDYTFFLNIVFLAIAAVLVGVHLRRKRTHRKEGGSQGGHHGGGAGAHGPEHSPSAA